MGTSTGGGGKVAATTPKTECSMLNYWYGSGPKCIVCVTKIDRKTVYASRKQWCGVCS